jgi:hypothetical protein
MLKRNSFATGALIGLVLPVVAFIISDLFKTNAYLVNKTALPYFAAVGLNLVLMRISFTKGGDATTKGIMLATFLIMLVIFIFKISPIK